MRCVDTWNLQGECSLLGLLYFFLRELIPFTHFSSVLISAAKSGVIDHLYPEQIDHL
jgi:hypothetical protein